MKDQTLARAGILAAVLVSIVVAGWELYVRQHDFDTSFDDNPALWADKRDQIGEPAEKATVFIGSSRIKFDLDIETWESLTGDHAIQLACVGSTPTPVLEHLANETDFKGKLVVDVTEVLFFSPDPGGGETPNKNLKYYKERTLAQRASFPLNYVLESCFAFLDKDRLSLNALLDELRIPNRPGVFQFPLFPPGFGRVQFDRQEYMTDKFLTDTAQINQVRGVWATLGKMQTEPPVTGARLDSMIAVVKTCVDKISARGGQVIFVRTPSSGPFLQGETMGYPREKYWDKLLADTKCKGIHYADYPVIAHFECPEFSHLNRADAIVFTKEFARILTEEKGWSFPGMKSSAH